MNVINNNPCNTCKHTKEWRGGSPIGKPSVCATCVGFRRWECETAPTLAHTTVLPGVPMGDFISPLSAYLKPTGYNVQKALGFLEIARATANKSKDRSTKVGTLFLDANYNIRSSGWNGFARGIDDSVEARHQRPAKYLWSCHSEENGVAQAARVGVSLDGCTALVTALHPCTVCSRMMIQAGVIRILAPANPDNDRWDEQEAVAMEMLAEAGVEVIRY